MWLRPLIYRRRGDGFDGFDPTLLPKPKQKNMHVHMRAPSVSAPPPPSRPRLCVWRVSVHVSMEHDVYRFTPRCLPCPL
jgi:hypothetical protein